jgi:hypothetical protein
MTLPNTWNWQVPNGSVGPVTLVITNPDGSPYDIDGLTWEYVVRPGAVVPVGAVLFSLTTTPNESGLLVVTTSPTSQVAVTLYPAATAGLSPGTYTHALWSNPGTDTATLWAAGRLLVVAVAQP